MDVITIIVRFITDIICTLYIHYFLLAFLTITASIKVYNMISIVKFTCTNKMNGKTVAITGSDRGIGYWTAYHIASRGARVILVCQFLSAGEKAKESLIKQTGNHDIDVYLIDLASFDSIRKFAKNFKERETRLDVLIHNAGTFGLSRQTKTCDNLSDIWQINYFGPFLLTNLLLDLLVKSSPSRIIFVSSFFHFGSFFRIGDWEQDNDWKAYINSKLGVILLANYLALGLKGTGVTANSLNPGMCYTKITHVWKAKATHILSKVFFFCYGNSVEECSRTSAILAADPGLTEITGKYFNNGKVSICRRLARNMVLAGQLWKESEKIVNLGENEKYCKYNAGAVINV